MWYTKEKRLDVALAHGVRVCANHGVFSRKGFVMRQKDPKAITSRQISNVQQASAKAKAGIDAVTKSPGVAAAEQIDIMVQNFLESVSSGKLEASLRGIDLNAWKAAALDGVSRVGPGMERKRATIEKFHTALQEYQLRYTQEIDNMPSGTLAASRDRMLKNFDEMSEFKFQK